MNRFFFNILIPVVLFSSCDRLNQMPKLNSQSISQKDSLIADYLKRHMNYMRSEYSQYDTNDISYKFLNYYVLKDIEYLHNLVEKEYADISSLKDISIFDSCSKQPPLEGMNIDEGYRFNYRDVSSPNAIIITLVKKEGNIFADLVVFQPGSENTMCKIVRKNRTILTNEFWEKMLNSLSYCDFWGLKTNNENYGFGGEFLTVRAYIKNGNGQGEPSAHFVQRWVTYKTSFYVPFKLICETLQVPIK